MTSLRKCLLLRPWLALAVVLSALAVRIVVPVGMMPAHDAGGATLIVCSGGAAASGTMPGMVMPPKGDPRPHGPTPTETPCAYSGLLAAAIETAAPPVPAPPPFAPVALLAAALIAATVRPRRLWPPRRGPPRIAYA